LSGTDADGEAETTPMQNGEPKNGKTFCKAPTTR
jgi:hypothetical protein